MYNRDIFLYLSESHFYDIDGGISILDNLHKVGIIIW